MANLPTGTVAFLMTDIEGSTRLVGRIGETFPELLNAHFAVLGQVVAANGGTMVSTEAALSVQQAVALGFETIDRLGPRA